MVGRGEGRGGGGDGDGDNNGCGRSSINMVEAVEVTMMDDDSGGDRRKDGSKGGDDMDGGSGSDGGSAGGRGDGDSNGGGYCSTNTVEVEKVTVMEVMNVVVMVMTTAIPVVV